MSNWTWPTRVRKASQGSAGTSTAGTPSSGITSIPGLDIGGGNVYFGAHARIRFVPNAGGCGDFCFVQGKIRKVRLKQPGQPAFSDARMLSTGDLYSLDIEKGGQTPCYPHVSDLPGGGKEMRDYPGVKNPWGSVQADGMDTRGLPDGTEMEVNWTFRTWVVCLNPRPTSILGYFDWSVALTLVVRRNRGATTGQVVMTRPRWSNNQDAENYRRIIREAPQHQGFAPQ